MSKTKKPTFIEDRCWGNIVAEVDHSTERWQELHFDASKPLRKKVLTAAIAGGNMDLFDFPGSYITWNLRKRDDYYLLSDAFVDVTVCVYKGTAATGSIDLNYVPMIFKDARLRIDNSYAEQKEDQVGLGMYALGLTEYSDSYSIAATTEGFYYDAGTASNTTRISSAANISAVGTTVIMYTCSIPLKHMFGILGNGRYAFNGQNVTLELQRNFDYANMFTNASDPTSGLNVYIHDIKLRVPCLQPSLDVTLQLQEKKGSSYEVLYNDWQVFTYDMDNQQSNNWIIDSSNDNPIGVYFMMQDSSRVGVDTAKHTLFDNMELKTIKCVVNGMEFPYEIYKSDFTTKDYHRLYSSLAKNDGSGKSHMISLQDYPLHTIVYFDIATAPRVNGDSTVQIRFDTQFGSAKSGRLYAIVINRKKMYVENKGQFQVIRFPDGK